jgi:hypothetical protein
VEIGYLPARMDSRIGPPGTDDFHIFLKKLRQSLLDYGLDAVSVFLYLPASVVGAVVLYKKRDVAYSGETGLRRRETGT